MVFLLLTLSLCLLLIISSALSGSRQRRRKRSRTTNSPTRRSRGPYSTKTWKGHEPAYHDSRIKRTTASTSWSVSARPDAHEPAYVYLVSNTRYHKVGITSANASTDRLRAHERNGLQTIQTWPTASLVIANQVEQAVIKWWRTEHNARRTSEPLPQGGQSETALNSDVQVDETQAFINLILNDASHMTISNSTIQKAQTGQLVEVTGHIRGSGRSTKNSSDWKVELVQGDEVLVLEFRSNTKLAKVDIGSVVSVRGMVEIIKNHKVMRNPQWKLPEIPSASHWHTPKTTSTTTKRRSTKGSKDYVEGRFVHRPRTSQTLKPSYFIETEDGIWEAFSEKRPIMVGPGVYVRAYGMKHPDDRKRIISVSKWDFSARPDSERDDVTSSD